MTPRAAMIGFGVAVLALSGRVSADVAVQATGPSAPAGPQRPLLFGTLELDEPPVSEKFQFVVRPRTKTCVDSGFRCAGLGADWSGTVTVMKMEDHRTLVATGWGMQINDGTSTSQRILTAGVRQRFGHRVWIQAGGGVAQGERTLELEGRFDSISTFVPAASAGVGVDLTDNVVVAVNTATALYVGDLSIYNFNIGLAVRF